MEHIDKSNTSSLSDFDDSLYTDPRIKQIREMQKRQYEELQQIRQTDPLLAQQIAYERLVGCGIIAKDGTLLI